MRSLRALPAAFLSLALITCTEGITPPSVTAPLTLSFNLGSVPITAVVVEVSALDLAGTLVFNLTVAGNTASGTIDIPVGMNRTVTVHAYDGAGNETHRGSVVINVVNGANPTANITLLPLTGSVPIVVTIGSYLVTVTPPTTNVATFATVQLAATITDGVNPLSVTPAWASLKPWIATVDANGLVRGLTVGTVTIVATYGGASGGATVLVTATNNAPPAVAITPIAGVQYAVMVVDYTLTDADSDPASVLIEYSVDNGVSWHTATRSGALGDPVTALTTSPGGTKHTFFWAALNDGVAVSGLVGVQLRITASDASTGLTTTTPSFTMLNDWQSFVTLGAGIFPRDQVVERTGEVAIGNLVADAMRHRTGTQLALINGGGLRAPLPSAFVPTNPAWRRSGCTPSLTCGLLMGDFFAVLPFSNRMVTRTVTGAQLWAALENGVSQMPAAAGRFPQISGFSFSYSLSAPSGSRVVSVTFNGQPLLADGTTYTLTTVDFLNTGGDGYTMFNDGTGTYREVAADVVLARAAALGTITPATSGRITALP